MFSKLVRLGRDAELKTLSNGTQICEFSAVYDVGFGQNKKAQWLKVALFGNRADKAAQYFQKGKQIVIYADDLTVETWQKQDGTTGHALSCKLQGWDFVSDGQPAQQPQQAQSMPANTQGYQQAPQQQAAGFDQFDSDIPFMRHPSNLAL